MLPIKSWTSEFQKSFKKLDELYAFLEWPLDPYLKEVSKTYSIFIPRRLAQKIKVLGPSSALAREFLPAREELLTLGGFKDPIGDLAFHKAPQLVHRYPSRALFTPTNLCPVHCRYCFRKNELSSQSEIFQSDFELTLDYLKKHPEISEIIFTGGDPLTLSNEKLRNILNRFQEIPSLKDIRFHTRYPMILPERIDEEFIQLIEDFSPLFRTISLGIHANHLEEFDEDVKSAIKLLSTTKLQLLSQTVLLKGVNDNGAALLELFNQFIELKVRPYYLHHPDQVKGGLHFYLPLSLGRGLYGELRSKLPGWALPTYIIDLPNGEGKTNAFNPEAHEFNGFFLNLKGIRKPYQEPQIPPVLN